MTILIITCLPKVNDLTHDFFVHPEVHLRSSHLRSWAHHGDRVFLALTIGLRDPPKRRVMFGEIFASGIGIGQYLVSVRPLLKVIHKVDLASCDPRAAHLTVRLAQVDVGESEACGKAEDLVRVEIRGG